MAIGIFTLRQQLRGLLSTNWPGAKTPYVEYLVVGGGGGGGGSSNTLGGGGGGGGVLTGLLPVVAGATNNITVGGGGAAGTGNVAGSVGQNSLINSVIAVGGGNGGNQGSNGAINPGGNGGSGGGSGLFNTVLSKGIFGQGNAGGAGYAGSANTASGGGGAGTAGFGPTTSAGGNGGAGIASAISGTVVTYGGGGGGAGYSPSSTSAGAGGAGGGGAGSNSGAATAGQANTGGGGGGAGAESPVSGGAGGSGIVIISYPDIYPALTTGGATSPTVSTSGSGSLLINTTSYVKYPNNAAFTLAGDFTIEGFFYPTNISAGPYFWSLGDDATSAGMCLYYSSGSSALRVYTNGGAPLTGTNISNNTWYHLSLVRSGSGSNNVVLYVNGTSVGSMTNTATFSSVSGNGFAVGAEYGGGVFGASSSFYASNIRVVKGTAIVPPAGGPTAPLTPVTNTSFLMSTVSGAYLADSSVNSLTATVVNTSAWNQLSPFATGLGYKNRVYTWAPNPSTGTSATGTFTV